MYVTDPQTLSARLPALILEEIRNGAFATCTRLPPEVELASHFDVSRNAIREALIRMESEGMIYRRQGVGTLINRYVVNAMPRLDLNYELETTIRSMGKTPSVPLIRTESILPDSTLIQTLEIPPDQPVLHSTRVICIDSVPQIYCEDFVSEHLIRTRRNQKKALEKSIYEFLTECCDITIETDLVEIQSIRAPLEVSYALNLEKNTPILSLTEVGLSSHGKPILFSNEYIVNRSLPQWIIRKKI